MSFVIKVLHQSIEDQILQSKYKQDAPCTHAIHYMYSFYVFDVIDSHFAKQLLWQCNQREEFDMDKVTIIND